MSDITFVYTVSSVDTMIQEISVSIQSLRLQRPSSYVLVFATPPIYESDVDHLRQIADEVRVRDHYLDPIQKNSNKKPRHYADMLYVCDVDSETVVFLDADTVILDNPEKLLGPGEIRARPDNGGMNHPNHLKKNSNKLKTHNWVPNTGVVVFQQGVHYGLADNWEQGIAIGKGKHPWTEQHGLAVAGHDYNWGKLSTSDHVFMWLDERPPNGVVFHFGGRWDSTLDPADLDTLDLLKRAVGTFLNKFY